MADVQAHLGQDAPVLQVGEAVLGAGAFAADQRVGLFLRGGRLGAPGGFGAGDDDRVVVGVVVEADEAQVGQGAEAGLAEPGAQVVVPGGGDLAGAARAGRRDPQQIPALVGECEEQQPVDLVFPRIISNSR